MDKRSPLVENMREYGEGYKEGGWGEGGDKKRTPIRFE